ncbi:hypothetical protein SDC9_123788 [bioreactor metagenome]|uniref:Uncharacterized protein n=1 Tax=bioreactor metagenome TaxID=1076179 RepID=A0A645CIL1_9ZZZZ
MGDPAGGVRLEGGHFATLALLAALGRWQPLVQIDQLAFGRQPRSGGVFGLESGCCLVHVGVRAGVGGLPSP